MGRTKRSNRLAGHTGAVATTAHLRSWAAGVLDMAGRVRVSRWDDVTAASLRYQVRCGDPALLRELQDVLGCGKVKGRTLSLTTLDAYDIARVYVPLMHTAGRDELRLVASWATTLGLRGSSEHLTQPVIELRQRLLRELRKVRAARRAIPSAQPQEDTPQEATGALVERSAPTAGPTDPEDSERHTSAPDASDAPSIPDGGTRKEED